MMHDDIIRSYRATKNQKQTAVNLGVSETTVFKVLLTAGIITSPLSERIKELKAAGMPEKDIADFLGISRSTVNKHTPYSRGTYLDKNKSINAVNIKKWRDKTKNG